MHQPVRQRVLLLPRHLRERRVKQRLHVQSIRERQPEEPGFAQLAVAQRAHDVVLQQTERVRRNPREDVVPEHRGRDEPRRFFAQARRERFAGGIEGAARVRVLTLQED